MTGLPDYGSDINVDKKIIPYLKYMPSKESFVGNDQENNKVNLKIDLNNKVAFDMNNIKSGWQWFKGDKTAPEKKMDAWVDGKCTPAPQPSAMTDANGEVKSWRRFCEIPCFNTVLGTRLFNFDGVGTYKSAQSIVAQWLEHRNNQVGTVFLYQYHGVDLKVSDRDKTRNITIPKFIFESEINRPEQFINISLNGNGKSSNTGDIPFQLVTRAQDLKSWALKIMAELEKNHKYYIVLEITRTELETLLLKVDDNPLQQKHKVSLKSIKAKLEKADNEYRNKKSNARRYRTG